MCFFFSLSILWCSQRGEFLKFHSNSCYWKSWTALDFSTFNFCFLAIYSLRGWKQNSRCKILIGCIHKSLLCITRIFIGKLHSRISDLDMQFQRWTRSKKGKLLIAAWMILRFTVLHSSWKQIDMQCHTSPRHGYMEMGTKNYSDDRSLVFCTRII